MSTINYPEADTIQRRPSLVRFEIAENELIVSGQLRDADVDLIVDWGRGLLDGAGECTVLDLTNAEPPSSTFVGTLARLAMRAHARAKTLVIRAAGRTADWLVWSGLHRVAQLDVSAHARRRSTRQTA